ncbi:MAG TPA: ROK family protein [Terriglobales bacterium]|nr:ROK family protein [Terriglobales bacterium]
MTNPSANHSRKKSGSRRTLAIDVGGTGIKAIVLNASGKPLTERARVPTPPRATPKKVLAIIEQLASSLGAFDRVSLGFPGVVRDGKLLTAPNLGPGWAGFGLAAELERRLRCPVRVANDADVQGMGCVTGHGVELVITVGTGFGSSLFVDGYNAHLELGHHPFRKGHTYEDELGHAALKQKGAGKWNRHLVEAVKLLQVTFNCDRLFIGGGNTKFITTKLPANVRVVSNVDGLLGGVKLWEGKAGRLHRVA